MLRAWSKAHTESMSDLCVLTRGGLRGRAGKGGGLTVQVTDGVGWVELDLQWNDSWEKHKHHHSQSHSGKNYKQASGWLPLGRRGLRLLFLFMFYSLRSSQLLKLMGDPWAYRSVEGETESQNHPLCFPPQSCHLVGVPTHCPSRE